MIKQKQYYIIFAITIIVIILLYKIMSTYNTYCIKYNNYNINVL